jgi:hypothetical protein
MYCKIFPANQLLENKMPIYDDQDAFHLPVFARFIPLELNGDTLPLGPGLSSLKFEFSNANSRNCCLLMKSSDSSCISEVDIPEKVNEQHFSQLRLINKIIPDKLTSQRINHQTSKALNIVSSNCLGILKLLNMSTHSRISILIRLKTK